MANTVYMSKTGLTGGEATKLDSIDGAGLVDGDAAFVNVSNVQYIYRLDADSAAVESSPNIIAPDTNAGNKRWILQGVPVTALGIGAWTDYSASSTVVGWAATPTKEILYCKVGKIVFVSFYITGTSNATGASFTLPDTASGFHGAACRVKDNGSWLATPGWIDITGAATVSISVNCGDGSVVFTSSGAKVVHGTFAYGIA